jgi:hypothetical protein
MTLAEQIGRERQRRTERRLLRLELLAQRNLIAAGLEGRGLVQIESDPRFQALTAKAQGLAAFSHLAARATYLRQAIDALARKKAVRRERASEGRTVRAATDA